MNLFIDGSWTGGPGTSEVEIVNPYDQSVVAKVDWAGTADVDRAVTAARGPFDAGGWTRGGARVGHSLCGLADRQLRPAEHHGGHAGARRPHAAAGSA